MPRHLLIAITLVTAVAIASASLRLRPSDPLAAHADSEVTTAALAGPIRTSIGPSTASAPRPDPSSADSGAEVEVGPRDREPVAARRGEGDPPKQEDEDVERPPRALVDLDTASREEIVAVLTEAIDDARRDRALAIDDEIVAGVAAEGHVRIIVSTPLSAGALEAGLVGIGLVDLRFYERLPFVAVDAGPEALLSLVENEGIEGIRIDAVLRTSLADSVPLIRGDVAHAGGYDGAGQVIAVLDTGVKTSHPMFAGRLVDEACFSLLGDCPGGGRVELGPGSGRPCEFGCGHGTHVAGIALGDDPEADLRGVAPAAGLISIQIFSEVDGAPGAYTSDVIAALEHVYDLSFFHPIGAVNLSLAGSLYRSQATCDSENAATKAAIDLLATREIAVVIAAGNDAESDAVAAPACISSGVSVGATTKTDHVASFSNSADFLSLLAPGASIESAFFHGYAFMSGTSMATPHVSGAFALLRQAAPESSRALRLAVLQSTGTPILDERNDVTAPRIDVALAIDALLLGSDPEMAPEPSGPASAADAGGANGGEGSGSSPTCGLVGLEAFAVLAVLRRRRAPRRG